MEFRNARHTNYLKPLIEFYTDIIGLEVLFSFENHNGYNAVFIGKPGYNWHLEFTVSKSNAEHQFDVDDIMVFYPTEKNEYNEIVRRIEKNNIEKIEAKNPFWNDNGIMIKDPDGYGVIVSNLKVK
ncbi:MAG: VOC family protein [Flavobacteriaceae bacterium]|nr:VOC family protein [Flavobacteriaceae bacterium]